MPDFGKPEYASYVKLCRELRLKRPLHEMPKPFQPYQEFYGWDQLEAGGMVYSYGLAQDFDAFVIQEEADPIWLPTLADWLERLKEEGWWRGFVLEPLAGGDYQVVATGPPIIEGPSGNSELIYPRQARTGATYEEAAARLWVAVRRLAAV